MASPAPAVKGDNKKGKGASQQNPSEVKVGDAPAPRVDELASTGWQGDLSNEALNELVEWQTSIAYDGFNPRNTISLLMKREPNTIKLKKEIGRLMTLYIERGNNLEKALGKMKDKGSSEVRNLMAKYSIKSRVGPTGSRDTITLARVSACFPVLTMTIMASLDNVRIIGDRGVLPKHWCFPAAASLLRAEDFTTPHGIAFLAWSLSFSRVVGGTDDPNVVLSYARIASQNSLIPNEDKDPATASCMWVKLRVMDEDNDIGQAE